ncbi:MAG: hypothetical protein ACI977_000849 [Candidatus Nanohaloarchaea archaeon]|jgi:hypothetical protein
MFQRLQLDEGSRQLLTVAGLPLVDGVFATLLISGSISGFSSIISFALTVFAGAGSLAVLFSQSESRKDARRMIYNITPYLIAGAVAVALVAPIFQQLFAVTQLQYVAGTALMLIALKLADIEFADRIQTHWVLLPGIIISFQSFSSFSLSTAYLMPAVATVAAACLSMIVFSFFREVNLNLDIIRKGSALVLALFSFSMFGAGIPGSTGLMIFGLSLVGSFISPRMDLQLPVFPHNLKNLR